MENKIVQFDAGYEDHYEEILQLGEELIDHYNKLDVATQLNWLLKHTQNEELTIMPIAMFNTYFRGKFNGDFLAFFNWLQEYDKDGVLNDFDTETHKWMCIDEEDKSFTTFSDLTPVAVAHCYFFELVRDIPTCMSLGFSKERAEEIKKFLDSCDPDVVTSAWDCLEETSWPYWS